MAAKNSVVRWEYLVETCDASNYQAALTMAGLRGWELVSVMPRLEYWLVTFKRSKT